MFDNCAADIGDDFASDIFCPLPLLTMLALYEEFKMKYWKNDLDVECETCIKITPIKIENGF
jgi:hypothetical protein